MSRLSLGGKLGEKFHQFTSQGTEKMGESIGEVIGYFIPDLLLVVFSEGISELIEGALKAVRVVLKGSEIGKLALEAVRVADVAVEALAKFVEKADIFLDTKYAELKEELLKIIELIKEWLGIEEEGAAKSLKTADNALDEGKAVSKVNSHANKNIIAPIKQKLGKKADSVVLGENLEITGVQRPPNTAAHHIVAGGDPRAEPARLILKREGIDINEADNGVFLPKNTKVTAPPATTHSGIHTNMYYQEINNRILSASPGTVRDVLNDIRIEILNGTFPY